MGIFFEKRSSDPQSPTTAFFFVVLVLGVLILPCVKCGELVGIQSCKDLSREKHYPGCHGASADECERSGYKWDGTYRDQHPDFYEERER